MRLERNGPLLSLSVGRRYFSMNQELLARIEALENRVNWLTLIVVVLLFAYLGFFTYVALALVFLIPLLVVTHRFLPAVARHCGRWTSYFRRWWAPSRLSQQV